MVGGSRSVCYASTMWSVPLSLVRNRIPRSVMRLWNSSTHKAFAGISSCLISTTMGTKYSSTSAAEVRKALRRLSATGAFETTFAAGRADALSATHLPVEAVWVGGPSRSIHFHSLDSRPLPDETPISPLLGLRSAVPSS